MGFPIGFSLTRLKFAHSRWFLRSCGLHPHVLHLDNGSLIHCWGPAQRNPKPALLLLHGFGSDGTISWEYQVGCLVKEFSLYLPDLLFFGESTTTNPQRSEFFQAECMRKAMQKLGVQEACVVGHSYGGFVAYRMAHEYPQFVKRLVIVSSGICMNPRSSDSLLQKFGATDIKEILVPDTPEHLRRTLSFVVHKLPWIPNFLYQDMLKSMRGDSQGKLELIGEDGLLLGRQNAPPLPKVEQEVLIIWGDQDQIFDIELAYQLKDFLGSKAQLAILRDVGHLPLLENPKQVNKMMVGFLVQ